MFNFIALYSPLEQFQIIPLINLALKFFGVDYTVTNEVFVLALVFLFMFSIFVILLKKDGSYALIPGKIQAVFEEVYNYVASILKDNVKKKPSQAFSILVSIFFFVLCLNLVGLIPYSFTLTSHLIVTLAISVSIFIGLIIIGVMVKGKDFVKLFLPGGTSFVLSLLLVPVEILSFIFKPISLAVRLFANMMAGHTLLKVIAGFILKIIGLTIYGFLIMYIPVCILVPLFGMELGVAFIQTVVVVTLISLYIEDKMGDNH